MRCECLDHVLVPCESYLRRVLREYAAYFNTPWPHQGVQQHLPDATAGSVLRSETDGVVRTVPVLGELHHAYQRAA